MAQMKRKEGLNARRRREELRGIDRRGSGGCGYIRTAKHRDASADDVKEVFVADLLDLLSNDRGIVAVDTRTAPGCESYHGVEDGGLISL